MSPTLPSPLSKNKNGEGKDRAILVQLAVLRIIKSHVGERYAISRARLLNTLKERGYKVDDRKMRDCISKLRLQTSDGAWICSNQKGDGYFYAETAEELQEYLYSERKRGVTILTKVSAQAKRALPELAGQFEIKRGMV